MIYRIYIDDTLVHRSDIPDENYQLVGITLDVEMGKSPSLKFTIPPSHPKKSLLKNFLSRFTVKEDELVLAEGRLFDSRQDIYNQVEWQAEGSLSYLTDSYVPAIKVEETIKALFTRYVNEHNSRVEDYKKFTVGQITIDNADTEKVKVDNDGYRYTADAIQNDLIDSYGGYLRTRYENGVRYLDYLKDYGHKTTQTIEYKKNLIDFALEVNPEDVFTYLIPTGDSNLKINNVNNGKDYIEVEGAKAKWGNKYLLKSFSGISDASTLLKEAKQYIKNHYEELPESLEITAIDLKLLGVNVESIHVGDVVRVTSTPNGVDKDYTCSAISYNLSQFGKTKYTLGKPKQDFTKKYNQKSSSTSSAINDTNSSLGRTNGRLSETQSKLEKYITATDDTLALMHENILLNANHIEANAKQIELNATLDADKFTQVSVELDAINAALKLKAEAEDVEKNFNSVEVTLDAMESEIALKASTEDVNGQINDVNLTLNSHDGRITANAKQLESDSKKFNEVSVELDAINATLALKAEAEDVEKNFNSVKVKLDAMEGEIALKASTEDVNGQINEVNLTLNSHDGRITANANNIIELNSQLVSVSGDLEVLGKTFTEQLEATKADISWLEGKVINTKTLNATTVSATGHLVGPDLGVTGEARLGSLVLGGSSVSKSSLTVVSSFTQASGETASTKNVTLLTMSLGNGVAHRPNAGDTITF